MLSSALISPLCFQVAAKKYVLRGVPFAHSNTQSVILDSGDPRPLGNGQILSVVSDKAILASVVGLLNGCCPAAIIGRIANIAINAVNTVLETGTQPHIREEILKRIAPAVAHGNTAPAIVAIGRFSRIVAAGLNPLPDRVLNCTRQAMSAILEFWAFSLPTAATLTRTSAQALACDNARIAAVATAKPIDNSLLGFEMLRFWRFRNDKPAVKAFANKINKAMIAARGMMTHAESSLQGSATSRGVGSTAGSLYSVRTSPLYHKTEQLRTRIVTRAAQEAAR